MTDKVSHVNAYLIIHPNGHIAEARFDEGEAVRTAELIQGVVAVVPVLATFRDGENRRFDISPENGETVKAEGQNGAETVTDKGGKL